MDDDTTITSFTNEATVSNNDSNEVVASKLNITVTKTQNGVTTPISVSSGNTITYVITVLNNGTTATGSMSFSDTIPTGLTYVTGSFKVGGVATTPTISSQTLTTTIPTLAGGATTNVEFQVTVN